LQAECSLQQAAYDRITVECNLLTIVGRLLTIVGSLPKIVSNLHATHICICSVNSAIRNNSHHPSVDAGIPGVNDGNTGVASLHAAFMQGRNFEKVRRECANNHSIIKSNSPITDLILSVATGTTRDVCGEQSANLCSHRLASLTTNSLLTILPCISARKYMTSGRLLLLIGHLIFNHACRLPLLPFDPVTIYEILSILSSVPAKFCQFDPIPTWLL
jgi:hypothetical protein